MEQTTDRRRKWFHKDGQMQPQDPRIAEIVAALRAGGKYRDIGERFKITPQRVYYIRLRAGLAGRYRRESRIKRKSAL